MYQVVWDRGCDTTEGSLNLTFYQSIFKSMNSYGSDVLLNLDVYIYLLNIRLNRFIQVSGSFVRQFERKCVQRIVHKASRCYIDWCNIHHWIMRLAALELLMPGVAKVSAVPGLTNDKLTCFSVIKMCKAIC